MKWEYKAIKLGYTEGVINDVTLNVAGKEDWELVSVDNETAYFKRPIQPKSESELLKYFDGARSSLV